MGRGKFKGKPTGRRQFSTPEDMMPANQSQTRQQLFKLYQKKKLALKKKFHEFKTLCDVDACMILYGPAACNNNDDQNRVDLDIFPSKPEEVKAILDRYATQAITGGKNDHKNRAGKIQGDISKTRRAAYKAKYPGCWDDRLLDASVDQLMNFVRLIDGKIEHSTLLAETVKENQRNSSTSFPEMNGLFNFNRMAPESYYPFDSVQQQHYQVDTQLEGIHNNNQQLDLNACDQFFFNGYAPPQVVSPYNMPSGGYFQFHPSSSGLLETMVFSNFDQTGNFCMGSNSVPTTWVEKNSEESNITSDNASDMMMLPAAIHSQVNKAEGNETEFTFDDLFCVDDLLRFLSNI